MQNFRNLEVWEKAHSMVKAVYKVSSSFPSHENYGITSQMRRASVSVPTNIAEGAARGSDTDFEWFLKVAFGSASEVEYLLLLSFELNYIGQRDFSDLSEKSKEVKKMLSGLIKKLDANSR